MSFVVINVTTELMMIDRLFQMFQLFLHYEKTQVLSCLLHSA